MPEFYGFPKVCFTAAPPAAWKSADHDSHIVWSDIIKDDAEEGYVGSCVNIFLTGLNNSGTSGGAPVEDQKPAFVAVPVFPGDHILFYLRLRNIKVGNAEQKIPMYFRTGRKTGKGEASPEGTEILYPFKHVKGFTVSWDDINEMALLTYWVNETMARYYLIQETCPGSRMRGGYEVFVDQRKRESDDEGTPIVVDPLNADECSPEDVQRVLYYAEGNPVLVRMDAEDRGYDEQIIIFNKPKRVAIPGVENIFGDKEPVLDATRCCSCCPPNPTVPPGRGWLTPGQTAPGVITSAYKPSTKEYGVSYVTAKGEQGPPGTAGAPGESAGAAPPGSLKPGDHVNIKADKDGKVIVENPPYPMVITPTPGSVPWQNYSMAHFEPPTSPTPNAVSYISMPPGPIEPVIYKTVPNTEGQSVPDPAERQRYEQLIAGGYPIPGRLVGSYDPSWVVGQPTYRWDPIVPPWEEELFNPDYRVSGTIKTGKICNDCGIGHPQGRYNACNILQGMYQTGVEFGGVDFSGAGFYECCRKNIYETILFFDTTTIEAEGLGAVDGIAVEATPLEIAKDAGGGRGKVAVYIDSYNYLSEGQSEPQIRAAMSENPLNRNPLRGTAPRNGDYSFGGVALSSLVVGKPVRLGWVNGQEALDGILRTGRSIISIRPKLDPETNVGPGQTAETRESIDMSPAQIAQIYQTAGGMTAKFTEENDIVCPDNNSDDGTPSSFCGYTIGSEVTYVQCSGCMGMRVGVRSQRAHIMFQVPDVSVLNKYDKAYLCLYLCGYADEMFTKAPCGTTGEPTGCWGIGVIEVSVGYGDASYKWEMLDVSTPVGSFKLSDISPMAIPLHISIPLAFPHPFPTNLINGGYIRLTVRLSPSDACDCLTACCSEGGHGYGSRFRITFQDRTYPDPCVHPRLVFAYNGYPGMDRNVVTWGDVKLRVFKKKRSRSDLFAVGNDKTYGSIDRGFLSIKS